MFRMSDILSKILQYARFGAYSLLLIKFLSSNDNIIKSFEHNTMPWFYYATSRLPII